MTADVPFTSGRAFAFGRDSAWCSEADTRDNIIARRNVLAGLWAGRLMRIPSHMVQSYVAAVHQADFCKPGDEDVIDKLLGDLNHSGVAVTRDDVRRNSVSYIVKQ
jgi:hypothetical protein